MNRCSLLLILLLLVPGCGGAPRQSAAMAPLELAPAQPLQTNHFQRDRVAGLSEDALREILAAPVFLAPGARLGVVPVETGYALDETLPLSDITGQLTERLADGGWFEGVSEISTDWPGTRSLAGLRELAARYRADYLLLYRHRFVDWRHTNAWGLSSLALIPALFTPHTTVEVSGVLEATLFEVRTGTLLFTVFERIRGEQDQTIWHPDRKLRHQKQALLTRAAAGLMTRIDARLQALIAARPAAEPLQIGQRSEAPDGPAG